MNVIAVNEHGVTMHDFIMCLALGLKKIPEGYHVEHLDGDTLNNQRHNLALFPDVE